MKKTRLNTTIPERFDWVDYSDKLTPEQREWLAKFDSEYRGTIYKDDNPIHNTPELQAKCYKNNTAMRRDIWYQFTQINVNTFPTESLLEILLQNTFHVNNYGIKRNK